MMADLVETMADKRGVAWTGALAAFRVSNAIRIPARALVRKR
jgi:hypothetical protein